MCGFCIEKSGIKDKSALAAEELHRLKPLDLDKHK